MTKATTGTIGALALSLLASTALAETVSLDVTAWKGNEAEPAGLPELIEAFEAAHPEIDVELSYVSRLDTDVVLPPRLQGNNPPDVMMVDMPLVKEWGDAGLLADLGQNSDWYGRVSPSLKAAISSGDAVYIMPLEVIGMGNFVNMDLLEKAGVAEIPTTIDDLKTACAKLADAGIKPMIFTGGFSAPLFLIANGLEQTENAAADLGLGEATFAEDAAFNAGLDSMRGLIEAQCFDPDDQAGLDPWSTALNEFQGGNFAMMPQGAWNIAAFSKIDGLNFAFAPIPSLKESGVALDLFGIGWAMSAASEKQDAARTFIDFFTEAENLQVMLDAEAAYSPFEGGQSGVPDLAAAYDASRAEGGIVNYPFALLQWPKSLEAEIWDSLTGFLLDTAKGNGEVLERWDIAVEDDF